MKPEIQASLEKLFQAREDRNLASERRAVAEQERKSNNLAAFVTLRESTIRPALTEIAQMHIDKGFPARIIERDEEVTSKGGTTQPYIKLSLEPETYSHDGTMRVEFTVYFEKEKNEIWIHKSTRHSSSPGERLFLTSVTGDWIQEQFLKYASQPY